MESSELLVQAYSHITRVVHQAADDLSQDQLAYRPEEGANSISWLVWHLTRIQDSHLSNVTQLEDAWLTEEWSDRFGMPGSATIGFSDGPEEVAAIRPPRAILLGYHDRVAGRVLDYLPTVIPTNSTESSIRTTILTLPPECDWSASFKTTCSTPDRPDTCAE